MQRAPEQLPRLRQLQAELQRAARLRFDPPLEAEFREHLSDLHQGPRLLSSLALIALLLGLVLVDQCCLGRQLPPLAVALVVLGICLPIGALQGARLWLARPGRVPRLRPQVTAALYVYVGAVYLGVLVLSTGDGSRPPYLYEAFLIHVIAMYFVSGLRFWPACAIGLGLWLGYLAVERAAGLSGPALAQSGLLLLAANAAGAAGRFATETMQRQQFLGGELLRQLASHDPLTGVLNRRAFESGLERAWRQARRENAPLTVAVLDLDHFKALNDREGHARGDALLVALAETLRDMAQRPLDLVARVGGDEFICLWFGVPDASVRALVGEVHATLNDRLADEQEGADPRVTVSLGALHLHPHQDLVPVTLFAQADAVLYHAKGSGRGRAALRDAERAEVVLL